MLTLENVMEELDKCLISYSCTIREALADLTIKHNLSEPESKSNQSARSLQQLQSDAPKLKGTAARIRIGFLLKRPLEQVSAGYHYLAKLIQVHTAALDSTCRLMYGVFPGSWFETELRSAYVSMLKCSDTCGELKLRLTDDANSCCVSSISDAAFAPDVSASKRTCSHM